MAKIISFHEEARRGLETGMNKLAASGAIRPDERVVALVTGHGLKTVEALTGAPGSTPTATIAPTLAAFEAAVDSIEETSKR